MSKKNGSKRMLVTGEGDNTELRMLVTTNKVTQREANNAGVMALLVAPSELEAIKKMVEPEYELENDRTFWCGAYNLFPILNMQE